LFREASNGCKLREGRKRFVRRTKETVHNPSDGRRGGGTKKRLETTRVIQNLEKKGNRSGEKTMAGGRIKQGGSRCPSLLTGFPGKKKAP